MNDYVAVLRAIYLHKVVKDMGTDNLNVHKCWECNPLWKDLPDLTDDIGIGSFQLDYGCEYLTRRLDKER